MKLRATLAMLALAVGAHAEVRLVPVTRGTLSADLRGEGARTLVFLPGNGGSRAQWERQLGHFAKQHRVIAFDLPGMGASPAPAKGGHGVAEQAADLAEALRALQVERYVLVAHSYGGAVAVALAGAEPGRVEGVFLLDVAGDVRAASEAARQQTKTNLDPARVDDARFARLKERMYGPILKDATAATRHQVLADLDRASKTAFLGCIAGLQDFDTGAALARFPGPVFNLATARMDPAMALHGRHPEASGSLLPDTSHWPMLDRPEAVIGALGRFLAGIQPERRHFDFWLGDWRVEDAVGQHLGDNRVTATMGGSVIQERWRGSKGGQGISLNAWLPGRKVWQQTWLDDQGQPLVLEGGLKDGAMVMEGATGKDARSRITWTPQPDGRVRQRWEQSADGGKTWTVAFDGFYRRRL
jgi:pimeloyl-ACP methyl ester carboxylesterase